MKIDVQRDKHSFGLGGGMGTEVFFHNGLIPARFYLSPANVVGMKSTMDIITLCNYYSIKRYDQDDYEFEKINLRGKLRL